MSIEWISVKVRVPENRRSVLIWGHCSGLGLRLNGPGGAFLGSSKFNPSPNGGEFDVERHGRFSHRLVTHWAEINGPSMPRPQPPRGPL